MNFRCRPNDVDIIIQIWGWMDSVVKHTKTAPAQYYWNTNGVPRTRGGKYFTVKLPGSEKPVTVDWKALAWNRYWFKEAFEKCSWSAICRAFATAMAM